jgi:phage-related protein
MLCVHEGELIVLNAFFKTTQRTPPAEIALARKRMSQL